MAKKFRTHSAYDDADHRNEKPAKQKSSSGVANLMGLSLNSKKIKKEKKRKDNGPKNLDVVSGSVGTNNSGSESAMQSEKKKKGKKHKTPKTEPFGSGERQLKTEVEPDIVAVPEKSKKKKKFANQTEVDESQTVIDVKKLKIEKTETSNPKKIKKEKNRTTKVGTNSQAQTPPTLLVKDVKVERDEEATVPKKPGKHKRQESEGQSDEISPKKKLKKKNKHNKNQSNEKGHFEQKPKDTAEQKPKAKNIVADRDVVTSESESEDEPEENEMDKVNQNILKQYSSKADKQKVPDDDSKEKEKEVKKEKRFTGPEHSIFIGNLPNTAKKSTMKSLFKKYGKILTMRFRTNDGVTLFKKKDRKEAKALNCYIRFETKAEAQAACAMNGHLVEGNRIRVTMHLQKQMGHASSTVFVGNINHKTTDNELYDFFNRIGEIEYVRQIADKGIGYVCFKKGVSIAKALKLNEQLLNGRPLRIMKVDPNKQVKRRNKKGNLVDKHHRGGKQPVAFERGDRKEDGSSKQKRPPKEFHGAVAAIPGKKHNKMKKGGSDRKKKMLAQKLNAAGRNK
ncbi:RNA-binding protein 34-like [Armigeres subalbatus]|uniref:RNA-binding protein 34-like n=1 Tax=Armigeres subalbatus TaxID=124917 RepID=UPI002ED3F567